MSASAVAGGRAAVVAPAACTYDVTHGQYEAPSKHQPGSIVRNEADAASRWAFRGGPPLRVGVFFAAEEASGIVASDGTAISGFTRHGIDRVIGDGAKRAGVKPQALLDALKNPNKITEGVDNLGRPYKVYTGSDARVVVNPETGQVVSVNPLSGAGANR